MLQTETDDDYLSEDEIREALGQLNDGDIRELRLAAKRLSGGVLDPDELISRTVSVVFDTQSENHRRCRRSYNFINFLIWSAMRGIASNMKTAKNSYENMAVHAGTEDDTDEFLSSFSVANQPTQEQRMIAQEICKEAFGLFDADDEAGLWLLGKADGLSPDEICAEMEIDRKRYEAVRKRVSRVIKKNYPEGFAL